jgi:hypothetical protein
MKTNYLKRYCGQNLEVNEDVADRNQDGLRGWRRARGNWVVEIAWRMSRIEVSGDVCLRRPRRPPRALQPMMMMMMMTMVMISKIKVYVKAKFFLVLDQAPTQEVIWSSGGIAPCIHLSSRSTVVSFATREMVPDTQTGLVGSRRTSNAESKGKIWGSYLKPKIVPLDVHHVVQSLH